MRPALRDVGGDPGTGSVPVLVGPLGEDSLAPSVVALVRTGALRDPDLAAEIRGSVVLRFTGMDGSAAYPSVRIDFRGDAIAVADDPADGDRAFDLEVSGRLPDVLALVSAPLTGGMPKPTSARGRQALARLADGRVEIDGPLRLGRKVIRLLRIELSDPTT